MNIEELNDSKALLVDMALKAYGPLLHGDILWQLLGYPSSGAMRNAIYRGTAPIRIVEFPNRQGKFGLVEEAIWWLFAQRCNYAPTLPFSKDGTENLSNSQLTELIEEYGILLNGLKIMSLLQINSKGELLDRHTEKSIPFPSFRMDHHRMEIFALLPEVIPFLQR